MALRNIRIMGDPVLEKKCKEIKEVTPRINELIDDMFDTMYEACGVGLAAPQVGILKRLVVIDTTGDDPHVLINPEIVLTEGEQTGSEGCLSVPGKRGYVRRPQKVTVRAQDRKGKPFELTGEDLLARALCHEIDHLDGVMYVDKMDYEIFEDKNEDKKETVYEIADLAYHVLVLMIEMGISIDDITGELASRHVIDHKVKQEKMT